MRFFITFACAAFAAGAVSWEHHVDGHDEHKGHEKSHLHAREADAMAAQAWEHAHGGKAPSYKGFEEHGHFARAEPEFHHEPAHHQGHPSPHHARSLPHFDEPNVDTSLEGYDHAAAQEYLTHAGHGHFARAADEEEEEPIDYSLEGYDHDLVARSLNEDQDEEVNYSLEGYDHDLVARGEADADDGGEGIFARGDKPKTWVPQDWKEQAWSKHLSHYSEHKTHTGTEHHAHPTNVARGIKEGWEKFTKKIDQGAKQEIKGVEHFGEEVKSFFARDANNAWPSDHEGYEHAHPTHHEHPQHTHAARGMPYEYAAHHNEPARLHRPHEAREAEAATPHFTAHATHVVPGHEDERTKHTPSKTAQPSKSTGGWGFPW